ncbi:MAG: DUF262 domain-containing protein [Gemmatimonadota bacterium]|nr:DUF262 domain-containing protein [Gemmatimonadota bacterium]
MSTFDSTKKSLKSLLAQVVEGKLQLPDFQRGWVWDDEHIRSLLVSVGRSFPIGAVMLLETGGEARFQVRLVEGLDPTQIKTDPERLILDGQQRLTSLTQVLMLNKPVLTREEKKRPLQRHYYIDIERALTDGLDEAIVAVDESKKIRANFGRDVVLDLSAPEDEYASFHFPCAHALDSQRWLVGLLKANPEKLNRYLEFDARVLENFRQYEVPVIELKRATSKEAVCLVFEKVNTGGVPLSVFELITATFAADGHNLRDDWFGSREKSIVGRQERLARKALLVDLQPSDFLQCVTLLETWKRRQADLKAGKSGKEVTAVSAKREHVLSIPLPAYLEWADRVEQGFLAADRLLRMQGFHSARFLPYRTQLVPFAAVMALIGDRWLQPITQTKLTRWFWSGVFGELYGGAVETRVANDLQDLMEWIEGSDSVPRTVADGGFQAGRLDTLSSRTSAAYRGLYVLLQREGTRDFFWKARMIDVDREELGIDIHHIFPKAWCKKSGIKPRVFNSIVNKTPISYLANRMIGGKAPSAYLAQLQDHDQVQLSISVMDAILGTHRIPARELRADDFGAFYEGRKKALLALIESVIGRESIRADGDPVPDDISDDGPELDAEDEATGLSMDSTTGKASQGAFVAALGTR